MPQIEIIVSNKLGLHARAAAKLTQLAGQFSGEIFISKGAQRVNAKSIMGVMMLAAGIGRTVKLEASGGDAEQALTAHWGAAALDGLQLPATAALGDVHAGADYRAHLAGVLCRRLVSRLSQQPAPANTQHGLLQRFLHPLFRSPP